MKKVTYCLLACLLLGCQSAPIQEDETDYYNPEETAYNGLLDGLIEEPFNPYEHGKQPQTETLTVSEGDPTQWPIFIPDEKADLITLDSVVAATDAEPYPYGTIWTVRTSEPVEPKLRAYVEDSRGRRLGTYIFWETGTVSVPWIPGATEVYFIIPALKDRAGNILEVRQLLWSDFDAASISLEERSD